MLQGQCPIGFQHVEVHGNGLAVDLDVLQRQALEEHVACRQIDPGQAAPQQAEA